ncbi:MAG: Ig-like domain-containing protein, partial [Gemmatimonadetes bacterium]|nr:Ig-like domain-containing protein [Gemmatimonadota bacterium]
MRAVLSSLALIAVVGCGADPPVATTLTVTPKEALLVSLGETVLLTVQIGDQYGDPMVGEAVTWASDRSGIATVSGGTVTAVANGTAVVTATVGQLTGTATVAVAQRARTVFVTPDRVLLGPPGEEAQMTFEALDSRGNVIEQPSATWTSADPAVATVSDGGLVTSV